MAWPNASIGGSLDTGLFKTMSASQPSRRRFGGFGGFGDEADFYEDDPDAAWLAASSQWGTPGMSRNEEDWLSAQQPRAFRRYRQEAERRNLAGDTQPYEWTDYLTAFDPNQMYAAATPGQKGLYRGRYAPYGGFQGLR